MAYGKGLEAILRDVEDAYDKELNKEEVIEIDLDEIVPNPFQPRKSFDNEALNELSQSIERHGLLQPILVMQDIKTDKFMIIAGERRFRATKILGSKTIRAIVVDLQDRNLREIALIENIQRENLNPIELANSYKELIEEYKITQETLSNIVKKSRTQITNTLRLLNLNSNTKELIESGKITQGHAKILVGLSKDEEKMVCDTIIGQKLSVRETEELIKQIKAKKISKTEKKGLGEFGENLKILHDNFLKYGVNSKINGKKLTLELEDLEKIINLIKIFEKIQ